MSRRIAVVYFLLFIFTYIPVVGGEDIGGPRYLGEPFVQNWDLLDLIISSQVFSINESHEGLMLVGRGYGVWEFDGIQWRRTPIANLPIELCRVMIWDKEKKRLYIGTMNDLGYAELDEENGWVFHSLRPLIPEGDRDFKDIHKICLSSYGDFFFTRGNHCYRFFQNRMEKLPFTVQGEYGYTINNRLFIMNSTGGIWEYKDSHIEILPGADQGQG